MKKGTASLLGINLQKFKELLRIDIIFMCIEDCLRSKVELTPL